MPTIIPFGSKSPVIHQSVYICDGVRITGDVEIGADSSIWFNTAIRGDVHSIRIGERTNIQDNSTLHVTTGTGPLHVGSDCTIGHRAILHACTIENGVLIGMGSIILDQAVIGEGSFVAAGSLVTPRTIVPPGVLVAGSPARVVRPLRDADREAITFSVRHYLAMVKGYREGTGMEALKS
jgi:carbonic anhydrase/acetyltransferase-like protein (isoleucine patch superfamily)